MNAVERLLAHGEQILGLFDEMYRERIGSGRDMSLPEVPVGLFYSIGLGVIETMPKGQYWLSAHWLQAAVEAAWLEKQQGETKDVFSRASDLLREHLARREQFLHSETRRRMLADVVFESRAWKPMSARVVLLAEQVAEEVERVELVSDDIEPLDWQRRKRRKLRRALDRLHSYARPPAPLTEAAEKKANSSRSRGGRRQNNEPLARDLLAGWKAFKPEEGRPRKLDYIARRPEVMAMKSPEARERKAALLLTALNSALHLRCEKKKRMRPPRG